MHRSNRLWAVYALASAVVPLTASAADLFTANFNSAADATNWNINRSGTTTAANSDATFGYDYSTLGIPAAPGATDTLGLRLRANLQQIPGSTTRTGITSGISVSPTGQSFTGTFTLEFDAWANFNGASNDSGLADNANSAGGTQNSIFAVGTSGTAAQTVGSTASSNTSNIDGVLFTTTGDGGINDDYRAFVASNTAAAATTGVYAAGTDNDTGGNSPRSNFNAWYNAIPSFAPHSAPAAQTAIDPLTQGGQTQGGTFGFAWHRVVITKDATTVTWDVDGFRIAAVDITGLTLGGNNVALGQSDVNSTTTIFNELVFTLIDNLKVTDQNGPATVAWASSTGGAITANVGWQGRITPKSFSAATFDIGTAGAYTVSLSTAGATTLGGLTVGRDNVTFTAPTTASALVVNGTLSVGSGSVTLPGASGAPTVVQALAVTDPAGKVDLSSGSLVVDYGTAGPSPIASIRQLADSGAGPDGLWTGPGLTSSLAAAIANHSATGAATAIGYGEASEYHARFGPAATFDGATVDDSAVLVRYTFAGDANLDGMVTDADVDIFVANYGATTAAWTAGDFNYNGRVDDIDLDLLAATSTADNPLITVSPAGYARLQALAAVPEPAALSLLATAGLALVHRRRR